MRSCCRSRERRAESEGEEEAAALQVGVRGLQLSSPPSSSSAAAAQEPQRHPPAAGGQAFPRRHQNHRQFSRRHDQQPTQPPPPPGVVLQPYCPQAGRADDAPSAGGDARRHRSFPPAETCAQRPDGAERPAEGSQLSGFLPSGGWRGELQPGLAFSEGPHGGQRPGPVRQISPSDKVRRGVQRSNRLVLRLTSCFLLLFFFSQQETRPPEKTPPTLPAFAALSLLLVFLFHLLCLLLVGLLLFLLRR